MSLETTRRTVAGTLVLALILSLGVAALLTAAPPAHAQTFFTVFNGGDDDPAVAGQLRYVIDQANAVAAGTEVVIEFTVESIILTRALQPLTHDQTTINGETPTGGFADISIFGDPGFEISADHCTVRNIFFGGPNSAGPGVVLRNSSYNSFQNVTVDAADEDGILVTSTDEGTPSSYNSFTGCVVTGVASTAAGPGGTSSDFYGIKLLEDGGLVVGNLLETTSVYGNGSGATHSGGGIGMFGNNCYYNSVQDCYVGTSDGTDDFGNELHGIVIGEAASTNYIGTASRNTIIGNGGDGVNINTGSNYNVVETNYIGLNTTGIFTVPNIGYGVYIDESDFTVVGADTGEEANTICGNGHGGVLVESSDGTQIEGNGIGTSKAGFQFDLGNAYNGVQIEAGNGNSIGGSGAASNTIAYNDRNGVQVRGDGQVNSIRQNSMFSNNFLGIDIDPLANSLNSPVIYPYGTPDSPNSYMAHPIILSAVEIDAPAPGTVVAAGTAIADSLVDLYYSNGGEGETFIATVTADGSGEWQLENVELTTGEYITAVATDTAGNSSEFAPEYLVTDGVPPEAGIAIDLGAVATNDPDVDLLLMAGDNYYAPDDLVYQVSNYGDFHDVSTWTPVPNILGIWTLPWTLLDPGTDGLKTVYYRVMDPDSNVTTTASSIYLKTSSPAGTVLINGGETITGSPDVTLDLTLNDAYYAPSECEMLVSNYPNFSGSAWQPYQDQIDWTLLGGSGDKTVYVMFRDPLGNTSGAFTDSITLDEDAPTGTISINDGAATTDSRDVALDLTVDDAYYTPAQCEMRVSNNSDFSGASWQPFSATLDWTLTDGQGEKKVYVQFRDPLGNVSETYEGSIIVELGAGPTWYLAEGTTAWGFDTYVTIENPTADDLNARLTYMLSDGSNITQIVGLPAMSQVTVNPRDAVGEVDFSTLVECIQGKTIAVDRTMSWTGAGAASPEGHSSIGVTAPTTIWYMPEGSSAHGFETWLTVQNPNAAEATCNITYMIEGETPVVKTKKVPGRTRASFNMADDIGGKDASIEMASSIPVITERAMYRDSRREGHESIGAHGGASDFFLAEGTTAWGFTTYLCVQNPNDAEATVTVTYMTPTGPVAQTPFVMPANSRKTIRVNDVLANSDFSTKVHGSLPIIAERPMYWNNGEGEASHDSVGMPKAHVNTYLPDGQTSGGRETFITVQNPHNVAVTVDISYLTPTGTGNVTFSETIPRNSRRTFNMADKISGRAAALVSCRNNTVIVERSMYWNSRGAGTNTIGGWVDTQ